MVHPSKGSSSKTPSITPENEKLFNRYKMFYDRLSKLKKEDSAGYQAILDKIINAIPGLDKSSSLSKVCKAIAKKESAELDKAVQAATQIFQSRIVKEGLRPSKSQRKEALDLAKTSDQFVRKLEKRLLIDSKVSLADMKKDGKTSAEVFTPRALIHKTASGIEERKAEEADLKRVEAIIVNGNNDLKQVDHAAELYHQIHNPKAKVYVSGFGGHATSPGVIFGQTEAHTMKQRLVDKGVPADNIILEPDATNSGENVRFVVELLKANGSPKNLLICGTPAAILRQVRSFEKQANYFWDTLLSYPQADLSPYYLTDREAVINLMCSLREIASFMDYTVNSEYMSPRAVKNQEGLEKAIQLLTTYYNRLNPGSRLKKSEVESLVNMFIEFSQAKAKGASLGELKEIKEKINNIQKPIIDYFRNVFNHIELAWVKNLSSDLSPHEHRQFINDFADYQLNALHISMSGHKIKE